MVAKRTLRKKERERQKKKGKSKKNLNNSNMPLRNHSLISFNYWQHSPQQSIGCPGKNGRFTKNEQKRGQIVYCSKKNNYK